MNRESQGTRKISNHSLMDYFLENLDIEMFSRVLYIVEIFDKE